MLLQRDQDSLRIVPFLHQWGTGGVTGYQSGLFLLKTSTNSDFLDVRLFVEMAVCYAYLDLRHKRADNS